MVDIGSVVFPRKLLKRFILLYKELPCLWDRECATYKNKQKRHDAVSKLTELVQEFDPSATRVHVLRKIESLRACVRREHKRVVESRQIAQTADEIYTPQLWYYDIFSFVFQDVASNRKMKQDGDVSHSQASQSEDDDEEEILGDDEPSFEHSNYSVDYNNMNTMVEVPDSNVSKRYGNFDDEQNKTPKRQWTEIEDEYDAIGINVAAKLRNLPPNMRILAEKLINDVLFQAQMNGLNSSTIISTTDPFKQDNV